MKFKKLTFSVATLLAVISMTACGAPAPTVAPTETPTETPTEVPTETPTETPTEVPTVTPTETPTEVPTETPTETPTEVPTVTPTETPTEPDPGVKTNDDFEKARITYTDKLGNEQHLNRNTLYKNKDDPHLDSNEPQRVLVIPLAFNNSKYDESPERIEKIKKVFFATDEEMEELESWVSVASYFEKSSYGKAKFEGYVPDDWCYWDGPEDNATNSVAAANYGVEWYKEEYAKENHGVLGEDAQPISYFDANKDGYVDLVWVVYSHPTTSPGEWWAHVTYSSNPAGTPEDPNVKTLGFASIDWMDGKLGGYDAHTYIHETGHTFGLDDYYCYKSAWAPFGKIDMMDNNIGDHNAYSKFTLGWVQPWIVDDSAEITLRSTTLTGDCFVIPSTNYNGTAFDEYLMVEFVTPEGLNKNDYTNAYSGVLGYDKPGIRVSHVDARVYNAESTRDSYLVDNPEEGFDLRIGNSKGGRVGIRSDGDYWPSAQGSADGRYMANLTLIESSFSPEKNVLTDYSYAASSNSLFKKGERLSFTSGGWAETFMPSGTNLWNKAKSITSWETSTTQNFEVDKTMTIDYSLRVLDIKKVDGEYQATVRVTKNA